MKGGKLGGRGRRKIRKKDQHRKGNKIAKDEEKGEKREDNFKKNIEKSIFYMSNIAWYCVSKRMRTQ